MSQVIPIYIPTYISDQNYNPTRVLPRLFFYNGLVDCETYWIESGSLTNSGVTFAQNHFPYFDNYNVVTGSFPTIDSESLLFNNEAAAYGEIPISNLYTKYWETYVSLLYNPRTRLFNCEAIIPLSDYYKMELNDICEWRGNYYHLRAINEYNLSNGECKIQLLGPLEPPVISNLLPVKECGFAFTSSISVAPSPIVFLTPDGYDSGSQIWYDESGNNNNYVVNGPTLISGSNGWQLNGTTNRLIGPSLNTELSGSGYTFLSYFRYTENTGDNSIEAIFRKGDTSAGQFGYISWKFQPTWVNGVATSMPKGAITNDGKRDYQFGSITKVTGSSVSVPATSMFGYVNSASFQGCTGCEYPTISTAYFNDNRIHYFTGSANGLNISGPFYNGYACASGSGWRPIPLGNETGSTYIGNYNGTNTLGANYTLKAFLLYNRNLTDAEIKYNYNYFTSSYGLI